MFGRVKGHLEKCVIFLRCPILRILLETKQFVHISEEDASPFFADFSKATVEIVVCDLLDLFLQEVIAGQCAVEKHITFENPDLVEITAVASCVGVLLRVEFLLLDFQRKVYRWQIQAAVIHQIQRGVWSKFAISMFTLRRNFVCDVLQPLYGRPVAANWHRAHLREGSLTDKVERIDKVVFERRQVADLESHV